MTQPSSPSPITRVVVVHAMNSTRESHWYSALVHRVEAAGLRVGLPAMPNPYDPKPDAWQAELESAIGPVDEGTVIVAHSVGNAAALRYLTSLPAGWALGGLVNVGGFTDPQPGNDATIPFVEGIDHELVRVSTAFRHAFVGTDDPEVPNELSEHLAQQLASTVHFVDGAGHFRDEDGYTEFTALEELVLGLAQPG